MDSGASLLDLVDIVSSAKSGTEEAKLEPEAEGESMAEVRSASTLSFNMYFKR